mmetsp:Transcript_11998/g.35348  ORF Transcript_11998/g.35348 Transcript_11998/m.35348 type:complete len:241 (-) Transcript_11998:213-935(-)
MWRRGGWKCELVLRVWHGLLRLRRAGFVRLHRDRHLFRLLELVHSFRRRGVRRRTDWGYDVLVRLWHGLHGLRRAVFVRQPDRRRRLYHRKHLLDRLGLRVHEGRVLRRGRGRLLRAERRPRRRPRVRRPRLHLVLRRAVLLHVYGLPRVQGPAQNNAERNTKGRGAAAGPNHPGRRGGRCLSGGSVLAAPCEHGLRAARDVVQHDREGRRAAREARAAPRESRRVQQVGVHEGGHHGVP